MVRGSLGPPAIPPLYPVERAASCSLPPTHAPRVDITPQESRYEPMGCSPSKYNDITPILHFPSFITAAVMFSSILDIVDTILFLDPILDVKLL
ncbi:hypothetical protein EVAR_59549_1 [Eumeta japonica]|uniref:Uncharacterized protein n=1 Tax=Eumeta variegata TaxID=151549 RepID=A0A4C1ZUH9_EUMVA|nr:hypothetical protein EVAR_59549_1 [Eumeta japonica]